MRRQKNSNDNMEYSHKKSKIQPEKNILHFLAKTLKLSKMLLYYNTRESSGKNKGRRK